jgi:hypothetical protein
MPRKGRYYLGRVIKVGRLDNDLLLEAFERPAVVRRGAYAWTFSNVRFLGDGPDYVYGKLAKYQPAGEVMVIEGREEVPAPEENLVAASSPFIYIPNQSAIAALHIWNQIEQGTFRRRFAEIVEATFDNFFVECSIEPISDIESFVVKLRGLERIHSIRAKVSPPNPLFGPAWRQVVEYLRRRNASELTISEQGGDEGLESRVTDMAEQVAGEDRQAELDAPLDLSDAAVLMAIDGYGRATVKGRTQQREVIVRTSETVQSFTFDTAPPAEDLYREVSRELGAIVDQRGLEHEEDA